MLGVPAVYQCIPFWFHSLTNDATECKETFDITGHPMVGPGEVMKLFQFESLRFLNIEHAHFMSDIN